MNILDKIKKDLPEILEKENLPQIKTFVNFQPYHIPEFPSFETTPNLAVYIVRDNPDDIGLNREYSIDLYLYVEKTEISLKINELLKYEKVLWNYIENNCMALTIENVLFPNYLAKENYSLIGFQIRVLEKGIFL